MFIPFTKVVVDEGWRTLICELTARGWECYYDSGSVMICALSGSSRTEACEFCTQYPCEGKITEPWSTKQVIHELMNALANANEIIIKTDYPNKTLYIVY